MNWKTIDLYCGVGHMLDLFFYSAKRRRPSIFAAALVQNTLTFSSAKFERLNRSDMAPEDLQYRLTTAKTITDRSIALQHSFTMPYMGIPWDSCYTRINKALFGSLSCIFTDRLSASLPPEAMPETAHSWQSEYGSGVDDGSNIIHAGHPVPSSALAKFTRQPPKQWPSKMVPLSWFSRTNFLVVQNQPEADSMSVRLVHIRAKLLAWETRYMEALITLHALVVRLKFELARIDDEICIAMPDMDNRGKCLKIYKIPRHDPPIPLGDIRRQIEDLKDLLQ